MLILFGDSELKRYVIKFCQSVLSFFNIVTRNFKNYICDSHFYCMCINVKLLQSIQSWMLSCFQLFATWWTVAHKTPLSMGFSRQEYWSGLPCLPLGDLPDPGIEPTSLTSPALAERFFTTQFSSVAQLCPTLCYPMNCSAHQASLSITNSRSLLKLMSIESVAIQPSHPLSSPSPPAPNPSQHQSLFQWVNFSHEVAKVLEFQL